MPVPYDPYNSQMYAFESGGTPAPYDPYNDQMYNFAASGHIDDNGAGASGTSPVYGAAIGAAGSLFDTYLQSRASERSMRLQQDSSAAALQFEREQAAEDKRRYDEMVRLQQAHYEAQQAQNEPFLQGGYSVLGAYGIPTPGRPQTLRDLSTVTA